MLNNDTVVKRNSLLKLVQFQKKNSLGFQCQYLFSSIIMKKKILFKQLEEKSINSLEQHHILHLEISM